MTALMNLQKSHLMNLKIQENKKFYENDFENWKKRWQERLSTNNKSSHKYVILMRKVNPLVIPRNCKVEEVLEEANKNNFKPVKKLLEIITKSYIEQEGIREYQIPTNTNEKYQTFCGT